MTKQELLDVIKMFSRNWLTVDGLWFSLVEDKYGLDAALELDLEMWERNALIEARRIKKYMGIDGGGIKGVLKAIRFLTVDPSNPFEYSMDGSNEAHIWYTRCQRQAENVIKSVT